MADASAYQGSQAFNQGGSGNEYVTRNTGSLSLAKPIVSLRGIASGIGLNVSLSFSAGTQGLLGLPKGWGFGLSYVIPNASITAQGKTYIIDLAWSDVTGYQSGLKYVNNNGLKFQYIDPPQPLPSGRSGTYSYKLRYTDGSNDYFDATGKLAEHADLFGNAITYYYTDEYAGPLNNQLASIIDSFGQTVQFQYDAYEILVVAPDQSKTSIVWSPQGVQSITDPLGNITIYSYIEQSGLNVISTVQYPTGLTTRVEYTAIAGLDASGNQHSFPAVSDLYHLDAAGNILDHTGYAFGTDTGGATFTGASAGYRMSSTQDSLMDSNNNAYIYDVLVSQIDQQGVTRRASRVYYNYLHLPVREEHYLISAAGAVSNGYRMQYEYQVDPDYHARATTYAQPVTVEQLVYDTATSGYRRLRKSVSSYDAFGQILSSEEYSFSSAQNAYISQLQSVLSYTRTSWGGELPTLETHTDQVTGYQRQISYTLTPDQKNIQSASVQYRANATQAWSVWKTKTSAFDSRGRTTSETLSWSRGAAVPAGSVNSSVSTFSYSYAASTYVIAVTDSLGNTTTTSYAVATFGGPSIKTVLPLGQKLTSQYDALGRITSNVDAMGYKTQTAYAVGANGNTVTATGPTNYLVQQRYDALGRLIAIADNGDPTKNGGSSPNRTLRSFTYDAFGQLSKATNELGLSMSYRYDSLGRVIQRTDPLGNVYGTSYADGQLRSDDTLNGILKSRAVLDAFGRVATLTVYPDPGDASQKFARQLTSSFDGFGLLRTSLLNSVPVGQGSITQLQQTDYTYDVEARVITETFTGSLGSQVQVVRSYVFDLMGKTISQSKTTSYADGRSYVASSDTFTYDAAGQLTRALNALGKSETYGYDRNGRMVQRVRLDGTTFTYKYDDNGQLTGMSWPGGSKSYAYLANGRTAEQSFGGEKMSFAYALDASLTSMLFPDGRRQSYNLDSFSRVTRSTDASGAVSSTSFDSYGRLATRQSSGDTLTYQYGTVNHTIGAYTGDVLSGANALSRQLQYDGYSNLKAVTTTNAAGNAVLASSYSRDMLGRITQITFSSATSTKPDLNFARNAAYDGLSQLTGSVTTYANGQPSHSVSYRYDGNHNVLAQVVNGTTTAFTYNQINQITSGGVRYDANGRMLADGAGSAYSYNDLDQLVSASRGGVAVSYAYNPDGSLARRVLNSQTSGFYYGAGAINAISTKAGSGPAKWTSFLIDTSLRRSAYSDSAASYYIAGADSTALLQSKADAGTAIAYDPYGLNMSGTDFGADKNFTWNQEYSDPATGLVYLRARNYHPALMRFCSMDSLQLDNRYGYCRGNPLNLVDPTGHMSTEAIFGLVFGAVVGIAVTAATMGAAAPVAAAVFGVETVSMSVGATAMAGAVAGATGTLAGDAVSAAITQEEFTVQRALLDVLGGAIGGAAGSVASVPAKAAAEAAALSKGMSKNAIKAVAWVCEKSVGGATSKATNTVVQEGVGGAISAFSGTAIHATESAAAGASKEFLSSGAYFGKLDARIIPVPLSDSAENLRLIARAQDPVGADMGNKLLAMAPQAKDGAGANLFGKAGSARQAQGSDYQMDSRAYGGNGASATAEYRPGEPVIGASSFVRPIKGSAFTAYDLANGGPTNPGAPADSLPAKLMSCFGAFSNAQTIANALQQDLFASYPHIDRYSFANWKRFPPL